MRKHAGMRRFPLHYFHSSCGADWELKVQSMMISIHLDRCCHQLTAKVTHIFIDEIHEHLSCFLDSNSIQQHPTAILHWILLLWWIMADSDLLNAIWCRPSCLTLLYGVNISKMLPYATHLSAWGAVLIAICCFSCCVGPLNLKALMGQLLSWMLRIKRYEVADTAG